MRLLSLLIITMLAAACGAKTTTPCSNALPGDRDCISPDEGKAEGWQGSDHPRRLAREFSLNYRLSELPTEGKSKKALWADDYWATAEGSTNHRWVDDATLSPLEKYDVAFHGWTPNPAYAQAVPATCGPNAQSEYGAYVDSLGPAAQFQSKKFQSRGRMFDGKDNDDDGQVDECDDGDGVEYWFGVCHAWASAAVLEPEPLKPVTVDGVRFEVSDIKALLLTLYDKTKTVSVGGKCHASKIELDDFGRPKDPDCRNVNAGTWHVVVTNLLGSKGRSFVMDREINYEVWNHPVAEFKVTTKRKVTIKQAHELLGAGDEDHDEYRFNEDATELYEVKMNVDVLVEAEPSKTPTGSEGLLEPENYHYILELNEDGKIIGGEWIGESKEDHPDFLWVPLEVYKVDPATIKPEDSWGKIFKFVGMLFGNKPRNPHVELSKVRMLLEASRAN